MTKDTDKTSALRKRAQAVLDETGVHTHPLSAGESKELIHTLNTYQIELELQNEELRNTQEALEKSRHKYLNLYEFAPVGYLTVDLRGHISKTNLTAAAMLAVERDRLINQPLSNFIQHADQDIYFRHRTLLVESRSRQSCELVMKTGKGTTFHAQMESVIQSSADSDSIAFWTVLSDISRRKEAEEALQQAKKHLEHRVRERTIELQKTHSQLLHAEKLAAIGKLSASIAHEFSNPLQGLLSIIKGIKGRTQLHEDDAQLMEMAFTECLRMRDLLHCLHDFNRPSSGKTAPIDVHAIIDAILLLGTKEFRKQKIHIEKNYAATLPLMIGVADQIKQVLLNLLNNAVDACEGGGVLTITTAAEDSNIMIKIKDSGVGIPPENMPFIFEPFFSTKAATKGTGLGLAVSSGIVQQHGGSLTVASTPGKGSIFSLVLPVNETSEPRQNTLY